MIAYEEEPIVVLSVPRSVTSLPELFTTEALFGETQTTQSFRVSATLALTHAPTVVVPPPVNRILTSISSAF